MPALPDGTECAPTARLQGFIFIAATIFIGQVLIVTFGGQMFNVTPLSLRHWLMIVGGTSIVLWVGELVRLIIKKTRMC